MAGEAAAAARVLLKFVTCVVSVSAQALSECRAVAVAGDQMFPEMSTTMHTLLLQP